MAGLIPGQALRHDFSYSAAMTRSLPLVSLLGGDAVAVRYVDALARHERHDLFAFGGEVEASISTKSDASRCHVNYSIGGAFDVAARIAPKRRTVDVIRQIVQPEKLGDRLTGLVGIVRGGKRPRVKLYLARSERVSSRQMQTLAVALAKRLRLAEPGIPPHGQTDVVAIEMGLDGVNRLKVYQTFPDVDAAQVLVTDPGVRQKMAAVWEQRPKDLGRCPVMVTIREGQATSVQVRVSGQANVDFAPVAPEGSVLSYVGLHLDTDDVTTYYVVPGRPLDPIAPLPGAAPAPTIEDMPKAIDISIGETCNNNCKFCVNPTESWAPLASKEALERTILKCAEMGYERLSFLGGEPTIHPHLPELVKTAYDAGYQEVMLITNGRRLADHAYAQQLADAGIKRALFMLLSHRADVHDEITRKPGSWAEAMEGVKGAQAAGITVGANIPINRANVDHLDETGAFFVKSGIKDLAYLYLTAYGNVLTNPGTMAPLEESAVHLRRAIERLRDDANVFIDNFPYCYLEGLEEYIVSEMANPWREIAYPSGAIVDVTDVYRFRKSRIPECDGCKWDTVCGGIQDVNEIDSIAKDLNAGLARMKELRGTGNA